MSTNDRSLVVLPIAAGVIFCGAIASTIVVQLIWPQQLTPQLLLAVCLFAAFAILAANLEIVVRSGFGLGGHIMILIASVVVFRQSGAFLAPVLVGVCGGLNFSHLREKKVVEDRVQLWCRQSRAGRE